MNSVNDGTYYLRQANENDEDLLLKWANDKEVRAASFSQKQIMSEEHKKWFHSVLNSESVFFFILMFNDKPVGQCRLETKDGTAEISYSIDKTMRGQGMGKMLLELVENEIELKYPRIKRMTGKVKPNNVASSKCFVESGFVETYKVFEKSVGGRE